MKKNSKEEREREKLSSHCFFFFLKMVDFRDPNDAMVDTTTRKGKQIKARSYTLFCPFAGNTNKNSAQTGFATCSLFNSNPFQFSNINNTYMSVIYPGKIKTIEHESTNGNFNKSQ